MLIYHFLKTSTKALMLLLFRIFTLFTRQRKSQTFSLSFSFIEQKHEKNTNIYFIPLQYNNVSIEKFRSMSSCNTTFNYTTQLLYKVNIAGIGV